MKERGVDGFFEKFLDKGSLFLDKTVLQSNYAPEEIPHREEQIQQIANILAPALRLDKPSNIFIYGKTGTGKTLSIKHTTTNMEKVASKKDIPLKVVYLNCKLRRVADTEYRLVSQIINEYGRTIPPTGLPTDEVYRVFFDILEKKQQVLVLILDEIDQLVKKAGDEILYNLTRINSELKNTQVSLVGVSNDLIFSDNLDPRVKSSLSEEEIIFPPYNALQIKDILNQRAKNALKEGVLSQGVIEKCAAYAAREHGDARRALELLRVAGEIAEREASKKILMKHLDLAEEKIEKDRVLDIVMTQPKQFQASLYSILKIYSKKRRHIFTGEIYEFYRGLCREINIRPLTQRRLSDILQELDMLGIINAKVISKGRYGRTREITVSLQPSTEKKVHEILEKELDLK